MGETNGKTEFYVRSAPPSGRKRFQKSPGCVAFLEKTCSDLLQLQMVRRGDSISSRTQRIDFAETTGGRRRRVRPFQRELSEFPQQFPQSCTVAWRLHEEQRTSNSVVEGYKRCGQNAILWRYGQKGTWRRGHVCPCRTAKTGKTARQVLIVEMRLIGA